MVQEVEVGLKISTALSFTMLDKVLMVLAEVYLGLRSALFLPIIQVILVYHHFYSYGDNRSGHRSHTSQFYAYNHGGVNISHPRCPQEDIPGGVHGENIHQNQPYYSYTSMPTYLHPIMPQHTHHNMPPHIYSSIPPHQVCLCSYCTSTPMYAPCVVPHYPHIPPLVYLHTSFIRLPSCVLPPHYRKNMS